MTATNRALSGGLDDVERQLPAIFESVADGVTVLDRSGTVRFANAAAARLMGHADPSDIVGRPSASLTGAFQLLDEDGTAFDPALLPTRRAFGGEEDPEATIRFRVKGTDEDRWSLVRARVLHGLAPDMDLVVTSFQDITSLKQVQLRLSFLSQASAVLGESVEYRETLSRIAWLSVPLIADWCVVDLIEDVNQVHRVAMAHADAELLALAEEVQRRWLPDEAHPGAVQQVMRDGKPVHVSQITDEMLSAAAHDDEHLESLRRLDIGEVLTVPLIGRGQVLGALTVGNGTHRLAFSVEEVVMVEELGRRAGAAVDAAQLLWEAKEAVRIRDEFMAAASHDMRTPLAAVRGYAQLARRHLGRDSTDTEAVDRWLKDIDESAARLTGLVSEFMDVSLLRGGQTVPLQPEPTDLVALVSERVREHQGAAEATHQFIISGDHHEIMGNWDQARLGRVVDNLLGNAVKFSPNGGQIEIRLKAGGARGSVAVVDHGIGIPPSDLTRIFTPMYRGANASGVAGTGLGLAGSRRLIELMGGEIKVHSRQGEGSTFTIWLPLVDPTPTHG